MGVVTYVITDNFLNSEYARFLFSGACLHGFIWELIPFISGLTQYNSRGIIPLGDMLDFVLIFALRYLVVREVHGITVHSACLC